MLRVERGGKKVATLTLGSDVRIKSLRLKLKWFFLRQCKQNFDSVYFPLDRD